MPTNAMGRAAAERSARSGGGARTGNSGNAGPAGARVVGSTPYGSRIYESTQGLSKGIQATRAPGMQQGHWGALNDQVGAYNAAAKAWNAGTGPSLANAINNFAPGGFSMQPPDINRPSTYTGGQYHVGWNPGSLLGLAGAMIPGAGIPLGMAGSKAYTAMGGQNAMISGPAVPGNWGTPSGPGTGMQQGGQAGVGQMAGKPTPDGAQQLQQLAQLHQNVPGNTSAPVSVGTPAVPTGPDYSKIMASLQQVTPNYGVNLPGYQYRRATV